MSVVRITALTLSVAVGLFIIVGLLLPGEILVSRSIDIEAPPEKVFPLVNDLEAFKRWSPWTEIDEDTRFELSGPDSGVGARMSWSSGNPEVGSGSQEIIRSRPPEQVVLMLDFAPRGSAQASFDLVSVDAGTRITWSFTYKTGYDLVGRYMGLLMEGLVGNKFEEGLERLKRLIETGQVQG